MGKSMRTSIQNNIQIVKLVKVQSTDLLLQKFIEAALALDTSIMEPFIPEDLLLQDMDKYRFLASLKDRFDNIRQQYPENWRVEPADLTCGFCNRGKPLAGFVVYAGCELLPYEKFGYFVEKDENGNTKDIYICNGFR